MPAVACAAEPPADKEPSARPDLYTCEGCEATEEKDPAEIDAVAAIAGPDEPGEQLILRGKVYLADGATPAHGVVIYLHQTNAEGYYAGGEGAPTRWQRRHGRLRGWAKTDADGSYEFQTIKPAPYPTMTMPAHIHLYVKEANLPPYYIDDVVFEGEFGVTDDYRDRMELRGGNGIVSLQTAADGAQLAVRDIVLERHPT